MNVLNAVPSGNPLFYDVVVAAWIDFQIAITLFFFYSLFYD